MGTAEQVAQATEIVVLVGQLIREKKQVPAGELYANLMGYMDIHTFDRIIGSLVGTRLVTRSNHLLTWIGPAAS